MHDPIPVSRLRGRSRYSAAKARLDHKKAPLRVLSASVINLILREVDIKLEASNSQHYQ